NLSWGMANLFSNYARDVINFVVNEMDVVVVAAAGNTTGQVDFYPASFTNVLSVAACDATDQIATWASYSPFVGLMAPGNAVVSTHRNGGYSNSTGSSFASPIVAGTAALVRARFPQLNARQVMEQIRVTADDVYDVGRNAGLKGMLGKGRLNMHRAVTEDYWPSIRSLAVHSSGANETLIFPGDTLRIKIDWFNYLKSTQNVQIKLSSTSPMVRPVSDQYYLPSAPAGDTLRMTGNGFEFVLDPTLSYGATLQFRIDIESGNYKDFEFITIRISNDFFIANSDNLQLTIANDGDLGYKNSSFFSGNGLVFNNSRIAHRMGIAMGTGETQLADNMVQTFSNFIRNKDFEAISLPVIQNREEVKNDITVKYKVKDNQIAGLPLVVEQKTLGWQHNADYGYMALEYRMVNTGKVNLQDVATGLYIDFDLKDHQKNRAYPEDENRFMIVSAETGDLFAGLGILSHNQPILQAIDQESMNGNQGDFDFSFTKKNKYELASGILQKTQAGVQGAGNIVSVMASVKNNIDAGWDQKVTFVILAANTEEDLKKAFEEALQKYQIEENRIENYGQFWLCENKSATIEEGGMPFELYADANLTQLVDSTLQHVTQPILKDTSLYIVSLAKGYRSKARILKINVDKPDAMFTMPNDGQLELAPGTSLKVDFENKSTGGQQFFWNFDNGYSSTTQHASTRFSNEGKYNIHLHVTSTLGCVNEITRELNVQYRSPQLQMASNATVCYREPVKLSASNSQKIRVYSDFRLSELLYEGSTFTSAPLEKETMFYVTNAAYTLESQAQTVRVKINRPHIEILAQPDTSKSPNPMYAIIFDNSSEPGDYVWMKDGGNSLLQTGEKSVSLPVDDASAQPIQLIKTNIEGCTDSAEYLLQPLAAQQPENLQLSGCRNTELEIAPVHKGVFAFYRDQAMQQLLHVGSSMNLQAGNSDQLVYYTCLNTFRQSEPAEIHIQVTGPE
ncbi:MAG: S8 family serine peptidase, partial [Balneolales bacterium]|nr:S8 family serine peptidase [Balneolales bacterium]